MRRLALTWLARSTIAASVLIFAATVAGSARAEDGSGEPDASAVSQYVEMVPTSSGPTSPGVGTEKRTPLPSRAQHALSKTSHPIATVLEKISTSSFYGAPVKKLEPTPVKKPEPTPVKKLEPTPVKKPEPTPTKARTNADVRRSRGEPGTSQPSVATTFQTTLRSIGAGSEAHMLGLIAVLVVTTAGAIAAAALRRRSA